MSAVTLHLPTLHLLCGKIAAGKSTLAANLAAQAGTVLIGEDAWLARLYPDEILTVTDYRRCAARLREAMAPHVENLLGCGLSVVLDFPANTRASRAWMRGIIARSGTAHLLHFLDVPDEICRARLHRRNAAGGHDFAAGDAEFDIITSYFEAPTRDEGFNIRCYTAG
ncbi:ATP-binding protein [Ferrovibrio sp.]|uniref:AAA family ATPase n=1 Tax=Ferrovibrio sp. TaxID=1917215 RepID=UPI00260F5466|nr:ATP-binding protein [Ferrovibrio sp.]